MIYLKLFLTFLEIGAVSFGGGYGMIPLIRDAVMSNGWLSEDEFINFIAISESTPGPLAVNISTFIGSTQAGIAGAFVATLGVVLPSFIIILIIAALINNLLRFRGVQAFLSGIRPCVVALILSTAVTLGLKALFGFENIHSALAVDIRAVAILTILACVGAVYKNCAIATYFDDQLISKRKRPVMAPGEMEQVILDKKKLGEYPDLSKITIKIEEA